MIIGNLIIVVLQVYSLLIILRAIISWVRIDRRNPFVRIVCGVTDPVLDPIQRVVPPVGGTLDISPIVALVLIQVIMRIVVRVF